MFQVLIDQLKRLGAKRIFIKPLANNDNSKQQIYLGSDFDVIKAIPSGEIRADGISSKGMIFKAPLNFYWVSLGGQIERAPNTQIIFYPKYPETRLSGFLRGTAAGSTVTPSKLMRAPTKAEREKRGTKKRYLVLGFNNDSVWAYCTDWEGQLNAEITDRLKSLTLATSVFYEYKQSSKTSEQRLLEKLLRLYLHGPISSCRLNKYNELIPYKAQNGAGYTLEAQFGITPNGSTDPDFMDWELKAHGRNAVTLMTPEPTKGLYIDDLFNFLKAHGTNLKENRMDFASRHTVGETNIKSGLTMHLEGYDPKTGDIIDPSGGLALRDHQNVLAAYWGFDKLVDHWKKKHSNTCFVTYQRIQGMPPSFHYGPHIILGKGASLDLFLRALYQSVIFYDPGVNMKLDNGKWRPKKRNQFRVRWTDIDKLYQQIKKIDLSQQKTF